MDIPRSVDGKVLSESLTEVYEVSTKRSHSERIPYFGKWEKCMPDRKGNFVSLEGEVWSAAISEPALPCLFYTFKDVQEYLARFSRGDGTYPKYDSYQAYRLESERFAHGGVVYTFEQFSAPDSFRARNPEKYPAHYFVHVRIRSRVMSWPRRREGHLEDLFK